MSETPRASMPPWGITIAFGGFGGLMLVATMLVALGRSRDPAPPANDSVAPDVSFRWDEPAQRQSWAKLAEDEKLSEIYKDLDKVTDASAAVQKLDQAQQTWEKRAAGQESKRDAVVERVTEEASFKASKAAGEAVLGKPIQHGTVTKLKELASSQRDPLLKATFAKTAEVYEAASTPKEQREEVARRSIQELSSALENTMVPQEKSAPAMLKHIEPAKQAVDRIRKAAVAKDFPELARAVGDGARAAGNMKQELEKAVASGDFQKDPSAYVAPVLGLTTMLASASGALDSPGAREAAQKLIQTVDTLIDTAMAAQMYVAAANPPLALKKTAILAVAKLISELLKALFGGDGSGGGSSGGKSESKPKPDGKQSPKPSPAPGKGTGPGGNHPEAKPARPARGGKSSPAVRDAVDRTVGGGTHPDPRQLDPKAISNEIGRRGEMSSAEQAATAEAIGEAAKELARNAANRGEPLGRDEVVEGVASAVETAVPGFATRLEAKANAQQRQAKVVESLLEAECRASDAKSPEQIRAARRRVVEQLLVTSEIPGAKQATFRGELLGLTDDPGQSPEKLARLIILAYLTHGIELPQPPAPGVD